VYGDTFSCFCCYFDVIATGEEDEEDGDYTFKNSYSGLIDHLRKDLQIELNTPIAHVAYEALPEPAPAAVETEATVAAAGACQCAAAGKCTCAGACAKCVAGQCACVKAATVTDATAVATGSCCKKAVAAETEGKCCAEKKCASKCAHKAADSAAAAPNTLVTITTKDGAVYRAKKILVTASPHVINNKLITFSPALPTEVSDAFSYTLMNPVIKVSSASSYCM
jgi:hypothetical protein